MSANEKFDCIHNFFNDRSLKQSNFISGHLRDLYSLSANERCPLDSVKSKRKVLLTDKKTSEMSVRYSEVSAIEYVRKTVNATFFK